MTQDVLTLLAQGRVPVEPIFDRLLKHCKIYDADRLEGEVHELMLVCERQSLDYSTIARNLYRYTTEHNIRSIDFNTADRLLCGMKRRWSEDEYLQEIYERVDLGWERCACPGCENMFPLGHSRQGPTVRRYCSKACRLSARHQRIGRTHRAVKAHRGDMLLADVCRNGHPRTEENIVRRKNGKRECKICKHEANNASYARRQAARKAALAAA